MHPIEHLRHVARAGDVDPALLAQEAAYGLAALSEDPRAVLTSCRRLLEFHPDNGPMWWTAAQVLGAESARAGAELAIAGLQDDPIRDELAIEVDDAAIVVTTLGPVISDALSERSDLEVRVVAERHAARILTGRLRSAHGPEILRFEPSELAEAAEGATLALVEPRAAGRQGALIEELGARLARHAHQAGLDRWTIIGIGRFFPDLLFEALLARLETTIEPELEPDDPDEIDAVPPADPTVLLGSEELGRLFLPRHSPTIAAALAQFPCPVPVEILANARLG